MSKQLSIFNYEQHLPNQISKLTQLCDQINRTLIMQTAIHKQALSLSEWAVLQSKCSQTFFIPG